MARSRRRTGNYTTARRTTATEAALRGIVQEHFPAYDDFPWEEIADYLLLLFPDWNAYNQNFVRIWSPTIMPGLTIPTVR
jgi:hypothetical protein